MNTLITKDAFVKISDVIFEIPPSFRSDMRVPARVIVREDMLDAILSDRALYQLVNMTTLPGITKYALAMPDIHEGYGFPIGGVAAMTLDDDGVISPGGIGYDINCGVRLLCVNVVARDVQNQIGTIAKQIFAHVPSGVGKAGRMVLSTHELDRVLREGAPYMVHKGFGTESDLEHCESFGVLSHADSTLVSKEAKGRGHDQLGTLGSGNHFIEVQTIDKIFHEPTARAFGLELGMITVMIHCGSRGLGHQVCTDYVRLMLHEQTKLNTPLVDRQLAYAPFKSEHGQAYLAAMQASANFAWANRHLIGHEIREAFRRVLGEQAKVRTLYDVAHNIGKVETHEIQGAKTKLFVHRKGATRAFGPKAYDLPQAFSHTGQPVIIPGTMGTASYVLVGSKESMDSSFGSACHGAGRVMSRQAAKKISSGKQVLQSLAKLGIQVFSNAHRGLAEEAPYAYKDVDDVVDVIHTANVALKVARLRPLAVIKGD